MTIRGPILVAMSGGVDSTVAAALLQEQGWDVAGITLKLYCYGESGRDRRACCGLEGIRDAQASARRLGIPHTVLDLEELFRIEVLDDFVSEYGRGRTPNPCIRCNTFVKFGPLLAWARRHGYEGIATGHYARLAEVERDGARRTLIRRAADPSKDQSYVLWGLSPDVLAGTRFPLGDLDKTEVRGRARALGLPVWDKKDSQDICFVEGRDYVAVVRERLGEGHPIFRPGEIRDLEDRVVGRHQGLVHYTVGQRKGIGPGGPDALHVVRLETAANILRVGPAAGLACGGLVADALNVLVPAAWLEEGPTQVRIRYRHAPVPARLRLDGESLHVRFEEAQPGVAPGQSCVVYREDLLLGGGVIAGPCACCPSH